MKRIGGAALGIGILGTLLLAALALAFKSSWTWPISLLSLAVTGLGWAFVLAWSARREQMANDTLRASIANLAQLLGQRVQVDCAELRQVDQMLGEAIEELMAAFKGFREEGHDRRSGDVQSAVIALQFRDVVGQKLGHVSAQLEELEKALRGIDEAAAQSSPGDLRRRIDELLPPLQRSRESSPVNQKSMGAGEIELF